MCKVLIISYPVTSALCSVVWIAKMHYGNWRFLEAYALSVQQKIERENYKLMPPSCPLFFCRRASPFWCPTHVELAGLADIVST